VLNRGISVGTLLPGGTTEESDMGILKYKRKQALSDDDDFFIWHNKTSGNIQVLLCYKILSTEEVNRHATGIKGISKLLQFCIIAQIQHIYNSCRCVKLTSICGSRFLGFTINISLILLCFNVSFFSSIFLWSQSGCLTLGTGFASCKEDKYLTCK